MFLKSKGIQLFLAVLIGLVVLMLPRPEGTKFNITGDPSRRLMQQIAKHFEPVSVTDPSTETYTVRAIHPGSAEGNADFLKKSIQTHQMQGVRIDYVDGLSPKAKRFLAVLVTLIFLFVLEPIPLEITAICIGVFLVAMNITDVKTAWAPYMHPVVVFIMCCLIFAISLDKAGLTKRLGFFYH